MITVSRKQYDMITTAYHSLMMLTLYVAILLQGYFQHKLFESAILVFSFLVMNLFYKEKLHSESLLKCWVYSFGAVLINTRLTLPLHQSILTSAVLGLMLSYSSCKAAIFMKRVRAMRLTITQKSNPLFNCKTANTEEFLTRCLKTGFTKEQTNFAVDALSCERMTEAKVASKYYIAIGSVKSQKLRLRKKLESDI